MKSCVCLGITFKLEVFFFTAHLIRSPTFRGAWRSFNLREGGRNFKGKWDTWLWFFDGTNQNIISKLPDKMDLVYVFCTTKMPHFNFIFFFHFSTKVLFNYISFILLNKRPFFLVNEKKNGKGHSSFIKRGNFEFKQLHYIWWLCIK